MGVTEFHVSNFPGVLGKHRVLVMHLNMLIEAGKAVKCEQSEEDVSNDVHIYDVKRNGNGLVLPFKVRISPSGGVEYLWCDYDMLKDGYIVWKKERKWVGSQIDTDAIIESWIAKEARGLYVVNTDTRPKRWERFRLNAKYYVSSMFAWWDIIPALAAGVLWLAQSEYRYPIVFGMMLYIWARLSSTRNEVRRNRTLNVQAARAAFPKWDEESRARLEKMGVSRWGPVFGIAAATRQLTQHAVWNRHGDSPYLLSSEYDIKFMFGIESGSWATGEYLFLMPDEERRKEASDG